MQKKSTIYQIRFSESLINELEWSVVTKENLLLTLQTLKTCFAQCAKKNHLKNFFEEVFMIR